MVEFNEKEMLERIEELMREKGLNKMELSRRSGIPYTTIQNFWKQGIANVQLSTIRKLANVFNMSIDELVNGTRPDAHVELLRILNSEDISVQIDGVEIDREFRKKLVSIISALTD